jgi:dsDNA-specific endonuclease/ATPase MutS2
VQKHIVKIKMKIMETINVGDKVSVIDDAIDGVVISVKQNEVTIETSDGFTLIFKPNELIKLGNEKLYQGNIATVNKDLIPKKRNVQQTFKTKSEIPTPDFDLHIEKLVKNHKSLSNYDILTIQMETAKRHIEFALKNRIPKIVLIHGVGEGVLKSELDFLLKRYEMISFREANYQRYGQGATEVYFKQNNK